LDDDDASLSCWRRLFIVRARDAARGTTIAVKLILLLPR
jgi:hypothetical protein